MRISGTLLALIVFLAWTGGVNAEGDAEFVQLLRSDSLAGWEHGATPRGWSIARGRLSGAAESSPLLSAWTFGDVELEFQWSVRAGGELVILLPRAPSGQSLELVFREGEGCGRLVDGDTELAPGWDLDAGSARQHTAAIRRVGELLDVTVDGHWLYQAKVAGAPRLGLGLAARGGRATIARLRAREPLGEGMFNGQDFSNWYTQGDISKWRYEGDVVAMEGAHDYLRTKRYYGNFTLSFEIQMKKGGNSGVGIRTPHEGWPTADGMELQLLDTPYAAEIRDQPYLAIYGHMPPLDRNDRSQQWNRVVVKAEGPMITAWVNGEMVQQAHVRRHPELKHRPMQGWIGFQDHDAWIRLRKVHLREAGADASLAAWSAERPDSAIAMLLDRVLNPERLSRKEALESGVAYKTFSSPAPLAPASDKPASEPAPPVKLPEQTLADLAGPGALVSLTRTSDEGQLSFYFDGESEPRIECAPAEMSAKLPLVGNDTNPLLTCLTYKKRLRVVLRGAPAGEWRLEWVRLPANVAVESNPDPKAGFPRGWLEASHTLLRWLSSGRHHQFDTRPWVAGERQTIEPEQSKPLATLEGAGIVQQFKLLAPRWTLENDDLWLEVTIDGEKQPAIAAPVRFLFPAADANYDNYFLQNAGGPTLLLAMPFGKGFSVKAMNRGGRAIEGVGVALSVEKLGQEKDVADRMRLQGVFVRGQGGGRLIDLKGRGRWVGLVAQLPEGLADGLASLLLDGQPQTGWSMGSLDTLLGQAGDFRRQLGGRQGALVWRFLALAPVDFDQSLVLTTGGSRVGDRLVWYYRIP